MRTTQTRIVSLVLVVAVLAGGGWLWARIGGGGDRSGVLYSFRAERRPFHVAIHETGVLRPRDVEILVGPISGEILWLADEGAYVKKGDKLAVIDDARSRDYLVGTQFDAQQVESRLNREKDELLHLEKILASDLELARIDLGREDQDLQALRDAPTSCDLRLAQLELESATLRGAAARNDYGRKEALLDKGVVSSNEVSKARMSLRRAEAYRDQARVEHELTRAGERPEDIRIAEEKVRQARIKLEQIEKTTAAQLALKKASVTVAEAEAYHLAQGLARMQKQIDNATVFATVEGTVLYNQQWGRPEEGKRVWESDPFLDIVNLSKMVIDTKVNEVDINSVGIGQKVLVRLEAFPDKEYHGKVTRLAGLAIDRSEDRQGMGQRNMSGVMVFDIAVEIDEDDPTLRPTMTANLEIIVDTIEDAIAVPHRAVVERDGKTLVYVRQGLRPVPREVALGTAGYSEVVVEKGLEEGDEVCVLGRNQ